MHREGVVFLLLCFFVSLHAGHVENEEICSWYSLYRNETGEHYTPTPAAFNVTDSNLTRTCRCPPGYAYMAGVSGLGMCGYCGDSSFVDSGDICRRCGHDLAFGYFASGCGGGDSGGVTTECSLCPEYVLYEDRQYEMRVLSGSVCFGNQDTQCMVCDTCAPGQFETMPCSMSSGFDRECMDCDSRCPDGEYVVGCGGGGSGNCFSCGARAAVDCETFEYLDDCGGVSHGICRSHPVCGFGEYLHITDFDMVGECMECDSGVCSDAEYLSGCGGVSNGTCEECACGNHSGWYSAGCGDGGAGVCTICGDCPAGYVRVGCGMKSPGYCALCDVEGAAAGPDSFVFDCASGLSAACSTRTCELGSYLVGCGDGHRGDCVSCDDGICGIGEVLVGCGGVGENVTSAGECVPCDDYRAVAEYGELLPGFCRLCPMGAEYYGESGGHCVCGAGFRTTGAFSEVDGVIVLDVSATGNDTAGCVPCGAGFASNGTAGAYGELGALECVSCAAKYGDGAMYYVQSGSRDRSCVSCDGVGVVAGVVDHTGLVLTGGGEFERSCGWGCMEDYEIRWDGLGCMMCDPGQQCGDGYVIESCPGGRELGECRPCDEYEAVSGSPAAVFGNEGVLGKTSCYFGCDGDSIDPEGVFVHMLGGELRVVSDKYGIRGVNVSSDIGGGVCAWVCDEGYVRNSLSVETGVCYKCDHALCGAGFFYDHDLGECPWDNSSVFYDLIHGDIGFLGPIELLLFEQDRFADTQDLCMDCDSIGITLPPNGEWIVASGAKCEFQCTNWDYWDDGMSDVSDDGMYFDFSRCEWRCPAGEVFGVEGRVHDGSCIECVSEKHCEVGEYLLGCEDGVILTASCGSCESLLGPLGTGEVWKHAVDIRFESGGNVTFGPGVCEKTCLPGYVVLDGRCQYCPVGACGAGQFLPMDASGCTVSECDTCSVCGAGEWQARGCRQEHDRACRPCRTCEVGVEYVSRPCVADNGLGGNGLDAMCSPCTACGVGKYWSAGCSSGSDGDRVCTSCPAGSYCLGGGEAPMACPLNSTSFVGAGSFHGCVCDDPEKRVEYDAESDIYACVDVFCGAGEYRDGLSCVACPPGSNSSAGSEGVLSCVCGAGEWRDLGGATAASASSFVCRSCVSSCPGDGNLGRVAASCDGTGFDHGGCICRDDVPYGTIVDSDTCEVSCVSGSVSVGDRLLVAPGSSLGRGGVLPGGVFSYSGGVWNIARMCVGVSFGVIRDIAVVPDYRGTGDYVFWYTVGYPASMGGGGMHAVFEGRLDQRGSIGECRELFGDKGVAGMGCGGDGELCTMMHGRGLLLREPRGIAVSASDPARSFYVNDYGNSRLLSIVYDDTSHVWHVRGFALAAGGGGALCVLGAFGGGILGDVLYYSSISTGSLRRVHVTYGSSGTGATGFWDDGAVSGWSHSGVVRSMAPCGHGMVCGVDFDGVLFHVSTSSGTVRTVSVGDRDFVGERGSGRVLWVTSGGALESVVVYSLDSSPHALYYYDWDQGYGGVFAHGLGVGALYASAVIGSPVVFVFDVNGNVQRLSVLVCDFGEVVSGAECRSLPCVTHGGVICDAGEEFSALQDSCVCRAGYYRSSISGYCVVCPEGAWCDGGSAHGAFPASDAAGGLHLCSDDFGTGAWSPAGSSVRTLCHCSGGHVMRYNVDTGNTGVSAMCETCAVGFYCPGGPGNGEYVCGAGSSTMGRGARFMGECLCNAGYQRNREGVCVNCGVLSNGFCVGVGGGNSSGVDDVAVTVVGFGVVGKGEGVLDSESASTFVAGLLGDLIGSGNGGSRRLLTSDNESGVFCGDYEAVLDPVLIAHYVGDSGASVWRVSCEAWGGSIDVGSLEAVRDAVSSSVSVLDVFSVDEYSSTVYAAFSSGTEVVECGPGEIVNAALDGCICAAGYAPISGVTVPCEPCDTDHFKPVSGGGECEPCPAGSLSTVGSAWCRCATGYALSDDGLQCISTDGSGDVYGDFKLFGLDRDLVLLSIAGLFSLVFFALSFFCFRG